MKYLKTLIIVSIVFFGECATAMVAEAQPQPREFTFSLDFQPKYSFKTDTNTLLIINQVDINKKKGNAKNLEVMRAGAFTAIKFAGEQLDALPHVRIINLVDSVSFNISADSIKHLAAKYHADYTLALTDYTTDVFMEGDYGTQPNYYTYVNLKFTLFEGNGTFYKKLNGAATLAQSRKPNESVLASLFVHPTLVKNKDSVNVASKTAALVALRDYVAHSETVKRPLYNDDELKPMVDEIFAGNFDKADTLSRPIINGKDLIMASKAAYNMAVVCEAQGDFEEAIILARKSAAKYKNAFALELLNDLKSE